MSSKKGKGKRPNKPPNLNPPQIKEDIVPKKEEDVPVAETAESESEQRVPEIVSEIPAITADLKDETNTPKKPKRNRGKKKKQDKDTEFEDTNIEKSITPLLEATSSSAPEVTAETKIDEVNKDKLNNETKTPETPNIMPTTRKNKNKNKKNTHEQQTSEKLDSKKEKEVAKIDDTDTELITNIPLDSVKVEEQIIVPNSPIQYEIMEQVKSSKKKNKRKKQHDSETLHKNEEQSEQPYTVDSQSQLNKKDLTEDLNNQITKEKQVQNIEKKIEEIATIDIKQEVLKDLPIRETSKEIGGKNKKKKKDKRLQEESQISQKIDSNVDMPTKEIKTLPTEMTSSVLLDHGDKEEILKSCDILQQLEEQVTKSKATIVKPVDKKNDKKSNQSFKDSLSKEEIITEEPIQKNITLSGTEITDTPHEVDKNITLSETEFKVTPYEDIASFPKDEIVTEKPIDKIITLSGTEITDTSHEVDKNITLSETEVKATPYEDTTSFPKDAIITEKPIDKNITLSGTKITDTPHEDTPAVENIKESNTLKSEFIPAPSGSMGKKRKKSPKLPVDTREKEKSEQSIQDIHNQSTELATDINQTKMSDILQPIIVQNTKIQQEILKVDDNQVKKEDQFEQNKAVLETNIGVSPETKKGKKGKKTPKPPINFENIGHEEGKPATENKGQSLSETAKVSGEVFYDLPSIEEIDIKSVKAGESGGSSTEITPDCIQYPRALSQQNVDNNNNTVIQELMITEESRLQVPHVVPDASFMKSSEEILTSPESKLSSLKIDSTINTKKSDEKQENTDLKSKMIEVNQDMEELRLSIEKSLAELTALEKSEDKVEVGTSESQFDIAKCAGDFISPIVNIDTKSENKESDVKNTNINKEIDVISSIEPNKIIENISLEKNPMESSSTTIESKDETKPIIDEKIVTDTNVSPEVHTLPICQTKKDHKGKNKSKRKGKQEQGSISNKSEGSEATTSEKSCSETSKTDKKTEQKAETSQEKGKQQSMNTTEDLNNETGASNSEIDKQNLTKFEPIENFEDAMTSSIDDVNKTFEMIADDAQESQVNPEINIKVSTKDKNIEPNEKNNPVSQPKNLLGHPDIPVPSSKTDYKKEKNKPPNAILAKVKIKDSVQIEKKKQSRESQTNNIKDLIKSKSNNDSFSSMVNETDEYIYKYTFRKVYLPNVCHVCKKELKQTRVSCSYCNLLFYCSPKHKDEDWPQHQALCFAVSTIGHLKDQKYIYADAKNITGHNYRLLRMQMIVSCEKVLKRKLVPWEQEVLLYPRMCFEITCREWRQNLLVDCDGCGQVSYCRDHPEHLSRAHQRWCKSYSLYQKLVCYQQTKGRLEPKLPSRVMIDHYRIPEKINEVLAIIYKDKIDMNDVEYAALTQLATAPLTTAYCNQLYSSKLNSTTANGVIKRSSFTIHVVGAELQFEADVLSKWEVFFLHLRPDVQVLRMVLIAPDLNPSNLPLDLLRKVKLCDDCQRSKRQIVFNFEDKKTYHQYYDSIDFTSPDIVCAFNPSIQRSSTYTGTDLWSSTIKCILKIKTPFVLTAYSLDELRRDLARVEEICGQDLNMVADARRNPFASVRPDRNFITDDEMPLLFKNYCFSIICGVF
ncbi:uncharacterized protein LOC113509395 [Galleria mellonella]|uniref:Uncharacterized protein LOC113509395 n=1 Tax=Galleria mellonella TaxID=7137 RepID=A0A6J1W7Q5_GALME|nr:uncharacterized protein LOC113509395 [Galleria mellonella]